MTLLRDYSAYLEALRSWNGQGDRPLHKIDAVLSYYCKRFLEGDANYILYEKPEGEVVLLQISRRDNALGILSVKPIVATPFEELERSVQDMGGSEWLKLCFFSNDEGVIAYETYYDTFLVSETSSLKIGDIRESASRIAKELPIPSGSVLVIDAPVFSFCPVLYALQQSGILTLLTPDNINDPHGCHPLHPISVKLNTAFGVFQPEYGTIYFLNVYPGQNRSDLFVPGLPYNEVLPETSQDCLYSYMRFFGDCFGNELVVVNGIDGRLNVKLYHETHSY